MGFILSCLVNLVYSLDIELVFIFVSLFIFEGSFWLYDELLQVSENLISSWFL